MRYKRRWFGRTLSVDPRIRRVAYAFFRDRDLYDCRTRNFRQGKPAARVRKQILPYIIQLLDFYAPHTLLLPETTTGGARRRGKEVTVLIRKLGQEALKRGIAVHFLSVAEVKSALDAKNRDDIHRAVCRRYPEMVLFEPRPRNKATQTERHTTPLFSAIAMYLAWEWRPTPNEAHPPRS